MDGLSEDADVLFVLTTNQVEMLEPALAARPGRIDQAIELSLPDETSRRRTLADPPDPNAASSPAWSERESSGWGRRDSAP